MASLPQQSQARRRSSPEVDSQHTRSPPGQTPSARSEDSQTIFVNTPPNEALDGQAQQPAQDATATVAQPVSADDDPNVKKCWICFSDSTEDMPESSPWRDPCPCALVAHEECLLDWIADTEAPKNQRGNGLAKPQILCPQCKAEIKLARPRDVVVESVGTIERLAIRATTPAALSMLTGLIVQGSVIHGVDTIFRIFGTRDGIRILQPWMRTHWTPWFDLSAGPRQMLRMLALRAVYEAQHWRLYLGLPLITPLLIASRTKLADSILPVLPVLFFATQAHSPSTSDLDFTSWPPSASMSFAVLPYIRAAYNHFYDRLWAAKIKQWDLEVQPRSTQPDQGLAGAQPMNAGGQAPAEDDDNVFEVRIDGDIWADWNEEEPPEQANDQQPQDMLNNAPAPPQQPPQEGANEAADPPPNIADNRPPPIQQAQPDPQPAGGERRLTFSPTAIAETVLGALIFPTIAEISGNLLKLALPTSWTTPGQIARTGWLGSTKFRPGAKGLLQEKWGRSLVGGCLFVVVKDAVMLYVKWRMASMHRERRVLDYDRKMKKRAGRV